MKFSLIIPVYNVAEFLPDCINSCLDQQSMVLGKDYEIILVNDGSTDKSGEIIDQTMHRFEARSAGHQTDAAAVASIGGGYLSINQPNSGVSSARNNGFRHAKGEYVWFIDSDDFIAPNSLSLINQLLDKEKSDIIEIKRNVIPEEYKYSSDRAISLQDLDKPQSGANTAINYVVKRDYLITKEISFKDGMAYGEDFLWCFWIKFHSNKDIPQVKETLYFYRQRASSAMHNKSFEKHLNGMLMMLDAYTEAINKYGANHSPEKIKELRHRINWTVDNILLDAVRLPHKKCLAIRQDLKSKGLINHELNWNRLTFKHGYKNFMSSLIGLPLKFKAYYIFLNYLLGR